MSKFLSFFIFLFFLFFNVNLLGDTKGDIAQINDLKESGLLSERDYNSLLEKSITKTKEYKKIESLRDSKTINSDQFENFKKNIIDKYINTNEKIVPNIIIGDLPIEDLSDSSAVKEATDNKVNEDAEELIKVKIGKVLKTDKGKSLGNDQALKKQDPVETGTSYKTLAGGSLHLMLDENTKIIIGNDSEIIINKFDIIDDKVHNCEIELISGSFNYSSLKKTSTDLSIVIGDSVLTSKGFDTNVALVKNEEETKFVNAGKSTVDFQDLVFTSGQSAAFGTESNSVNEETKSVIKSVSINNNISKSEEGADKLIGTVLGDFSMTEMGSSSSSGDIRDGNPDPGDVGKPTIVVSSSHSGSGMSGSSSGGSSGGGSVGGGCQ